MIRDHQGSIIKAYSKPIGDGFTIEVKIVVLLEGLIQTKALGLLNFVIEGDSTVVISWVPKKERGSWIQYPYRVGMLYLMGSSLSKSDDK